MERRIKGLQIIDIENLVDDNEANLPYQAHCVVMEVQSDDELAGWGRSL